MKKLALFASVCLIFGLGTKVNAQSISTRDIDIPWSFYIPCLDEYAIGAITLHSLEHYNKNGELTKYHYQPSGGLIIGEKSGTVYHAVGRTQEQIKSAYTNGAWTDTYVDKAMCVGVGNDAVTWRIEIVWHITITKEGETTSEVDKYTTSCE
jgi:hypothetical protein